MAGVHGLEDPVVTALPTSRGDPRVTTFGDRVVETVRFLDLDQGADDESWGLDDVYVWIR